jgi:hypothetical protein
MGNTLAWKILSDGLWSYTTHFRYYLKVLLPWLLLLIALFWIITDLEIYYFASDNSDSVFPISYRIEILKYLLEGLALASIAVCWHRHVLLEEPHKLGNLLLLNKRVFRYWLVGLLVSALLGLCFAPAIISFGIASSDEESRLQLIAAAVLFIFGFILAIQMLYRFSLCLPAIALERNDYGFKNAWQDSKGVFLQFIILAFLLGFVGRLISQVYGMLESNLTTIQGYTNYHIVLSLEPVLDMLFSGLLISVLTESYRYFSIGKKIENQTVGKPWKKHDNIPL